MGHDSIKLQCHRRVGGLKLIVALDSAVH
jgi:hypothetical protein